MAIRIEEEGCLYRGRHAYFPSIVASAETDHLVASFDMGGGMEAPDVRTYVCRSTDGGHTWSDPAIIDEPRGLDFPASTLGRITRLSDGTLVALQLICNRARTGHGLANPKTEGYVETRFALRESRDGGREWSFPRWVEPPIAWQAFEICSPIIEVSDRRWLLPTSLWPNWDGECPFGMKAVVFVSDDRGATWNRCVDVMNAWDKRVASWEQKHTRLSNGRRLVVCWAYDYVRKESLPTRYTFSSNDGDAYGPILEAPITGETCTPLALPGNHVLCVYRRVDIRGLWAHLARIDGETWMPVADAALWGTSRSSYDAASSSKTEEMSTLQFGYPQGVQLRDGSIFVVFWCVETGVANIRWIRLRVEVDADTAKSGEAHGRG